MGTNTSAGSTIAISAAAPASFDATGFAALTFTEVGEVTNIGEFGREYNKVVYNPLKTRATQKRKGSYDPGALNLQLTFDRANAGQTLMKTASKADTNYSFKVTTQNGDKYYFTAQVFTFKTSVGGVDDLTTATSLIEINADPATGNDIVEVAGP